MIKIFGALLIVIGCGGVGIKMAASQIRNEHLVRKLISVLDYMECELEYRLTPLPDLCRDCAKQCSGVLCEVFQNLTSELESQVSPDVDRCMRVVLSNIKNLPNNIASLLKQFGYSLGRFDLSGQIKGIYAVREECNRTLHELMNNKEVRIRSYQTLAICAGIALAILFI